MRFNYFCLAVIDIWSHYVEYGSAWFFGKSIAALFFLLFILDVFICPKVGYVCVLHEV